MISGESFTSFVRWSRSFKDIITSGSSIVDTAKLLRGHGLLVTDVVVFMDREQGGVQNLEAEGIRVHAVANLSLVLDTLCHHGKLSEDQRQSVLDFVRTNSIKAAAPGKQGQK